MGTGIVINGKNVELVISDPYRKIRQLIDNYQPTNESEIEVLFLRLQSERPLKESTREDWWLIDLLVSYWSAKIEFFMRKTWSKVSKGLTSKRGKIILQGEILEISHMISAAKEALSRWGERGSDYFDRGRRQLHLDLMRSVLDSPPGPDEVRFMIRDGVSDLSGITKIDGRNDPGRDIVNVTPLPKLREDDLMGQQLRDMRLVHSWQTGRVTIGDWNFPVIETEDRQIGVPVEKILAEFGGCPLGYTVNKKRKAIDFGGYDYRQRRCQCSFSNSCPGGQLLSAGTLATLAKKLWYIKKGKVTIQNLLPGWRRMLDNKK